MARFIVYTYQFSPIINFQSRIGEDILSMQQRMERKQEFLQEILDRLTDDQLHFKYRNKEYNHRSCMNTQGVVILKLANNINAFIEQDFRREILPHHPSCFVLIDNRLDVQHILIEDKTDAFTSTDVVKSILASFFTHYLEEYGLEITINKAYQEREFWDTIRQYPQGIQMVRFQMSYPNLPQVWQSVGDMIRESSLETNSHKTSIEFHSQKGELLTLDENNENINGLVNASAEGGIPVVLKVNGFRAHKKTGTTEKSVEIDSLEAIIQPDMFQGAFERVIERLNQIFR